MVLKLSIGLGIPSDRCKFRILTAACNFVSLREKKCVNYVIKKGGGKTKKEKKTLLITRLAKKARNSCVVLQCLLAKLNES